MTLVYSRDMDGPATHALIIGCGRFRDYKPDGSADRVATPAGARKIARFLIDHQDDLVAPLASIECLISDPAVARGKDVLHLGAFPHDPRPDDAVEAALADAVRAAGDRWLDRCRPGDHMFFYMASHGVVERDRSALGAMEDLGVVPRRRWSQTLNVQHLAVSLPVTGAQSCWVFLDACQEVIPELIEQYDGAQALILMTPSLQELTQVSVRSVALAGSRFGGMAWAPTNGDPPWFTQALIQGLSGCCVDAIDGLGWVVSGQQILFGLAKVANAALDYPGLNTEQLTNFNQIAGLVKVAQPMIPVAVRTQIEGHINQAQSVTADDGNGTIETRADNEMTWRFRVEPSGRMFTARALFGPGGPVYQDGRFPAQPPAQVVELRP